MVKELRVNIMQHREELRSRRDTLGVQRYNEVRWNYPRLLEKQEIFWKQRAKQFWLGEGDQNTRFFHNFASVRKEHNKIKKLKDEHGLWKETDEEIQAVITSYFETQFRTTTTDEHMSDQYRVQKVTEEYNQKLMLPITEEEVKKAVFAMHKEKSSGIDGLNPDFSKFIGLLWVLM